MYDACDQPWTGFLVSEAPLEVQSGDNVGSSGYNPPDFVLKAAKEVLDRVDCNQYAPTKVTKTSGMQLAMPTTITKYNIYVHSKDGG